MMNAERDVVTSRSAFIIHHSSGVCERWATALGHVLVAMQADTENADDTDDTDFFPA
jgi:hypothetical protein